MPVHVLAPGPRAKGPSEPIAIFKAVAHEALPYPQSFQNEHGRLRSSPPAGGSPLSAASLETLLNAGLVDILAESQAEVPLKYSMFAIKSFIS